MWREMKEMRAKGRKQEKEWRKGKEELQRQVKEGKKVSKIERREEEGGGLGGDKF